MGTSNLPNKSDRNSHDQNMKQQSSESTTNDEERVHRNENSHSPSQKQQQEQSYSDQPPARLLFQQSRVYLLPPPYQEYQQQIVQANSNQPGQSTAQQPALSRQSNERPVQPGQAHQTYSGQHGRQGYYGTQQGTQNIQYIYPYPAEPPSVQGSPMVRPGPRRGQREEPELEGWKGFETSKIRRLFVRKVYAILMLQLLCSMAIIALFVFEPNVKRFVRENIYLLYVSLAIFMGIYIGMACFESMRRNFPTNIIALTIFTLASSYMLGAISSTYNTEAVFMAVGVCAAVCLAVSIFSFYTKFDFTSCGGILCILLLVLILFGLIAIFIPSKVMTMIYAGAGAIVFTLFLAYDTQLMMGGKSCELSPEEHVFAAIQLYVDIINIFLFLLMLFGNRE